MTIDYKKTAACYAITQKLLLSVFLAMAMKIQVTNLNGCKVLLGLTVVLSARLDPF